MELTCVSPHQTQRVGEIGIAVAARFRLSISRRHWHRVALAGSQKQIGLDAVLLGIEIVIAAAQGVEFLVGAAFHNLALVR